MEPEETRAVTEQQTLPLQPSETLPPGLTTSLCNAQARLQPCGAKTGTLELAQCLTLVAPVGMTERERQDWITVARNELRGIPADLMQRGCSHARKVADHPSKIIPAIFKEVGAVWESRKKSLRSIEREIGEAQAAAARLALPAQEICSPEEARRIIAEVAASRKVDE